MSNKFSAWTEIPGNRGAARHLRSALDSGAAVAFVGAGASVPNYPLWAELLHLLIDAAEEEGLLQSSTKRSLIESLKSQPTHAAEELQEILSSGLLRERLSAVFDPGRGMTEVHAQLLRLPFKGYVTSNYDQGLSLARASIGQQTHPLPITWQNPNRDKLFLDSETSRSSGKPILHLHGLASDPESLVLSEQQYRGPYTDPSFKRFFSSLWSHQVMVIVGFGFTDHWIQALARTTVAEAKDDQRAGPRHYAILGLSSGGDEDVRLQRRQMQRTFNSRVLFYPVLKTSDGRPDHSNLRDLLKSFEEAPSRDSGHRLEPAFHSSSYGRNDLAPEVPGSDVRLPFLRMTFHRLGENNYAMELEARLDDSLEVLRLRREFSVRALTPQVLAEAIFRSGRSRALFETILGLRSKKVVLRMQVCLDAAEHTLDSVDWERIEWQGEQLGFSRHIVFSRRFLFAGEEHSFLKINSSRDLTFSVIDLPQEPAREEPGRQWLVPARVTTELLAEFDSVCSWTGEDSIDLDNIWQELENAELVYLNLPLGIRLDSGFSDLKIPLPRAPSGQLFSTDPESLFAVLRKLAHNGPSVIILPTLASYNQDIDPHVTERFAGDFAKTGVSAVIAPAGSGWTPPLWEEVIQGIIGELRNHGLIDLAVTRAMLQTAAVRAMDSARARLYLRSKSGRLFYRPGLVTIGKPESRSERSSWEILSELFSDPDQPSQCVVLVGPEFDPELSLSRRRIARTLAARYGFSLSRRDMEDLARVAEYIRVSQPIPEEAVKQDVGGDRITKPHISAFVECTKRYLLKHPLLRRSRALHLDENSTLEDITSHVGEQRLKDPGSPYLELADLRVKHYVTPSFHSILENALEKRGRKAISTSFSRRVDPSISTRAATRSINQPLVYHCFGNFRQPDSLLLSETDFLEFFASFCREDDPLNQIVRGDLVDSSLLVLGFNPNSWDFKLLFSAIRSMSGRELSESRVHVAVQVDPEDDFTIDPDGARNFYSGLLSELGKEGVLLYWGRSTQFLADLRSRVPNAFQKGRS